MKKGRGRGIWWSQLKRFLKMPFGIHPEMKGPSIPLHPQDKKLAVDIAAKIDSGESCAFLGPYVTPETIALLARALVVGTVKRPKVVVYSPDMDIRRLYKRLYGVSGLINRGYPMKSQIPHASTFSEIDKCRDRNTASIILDGRRWRRQAYVKRGLMNALEFSGARIFLLRDNWTVSRRLLQENGIPVKHIPPSGEVMPNGWPALKDYLQRLNNYSSRVILNPTTVSEEVPAFVELEHSTRKLINASAVIGNCGPTPFFAEAANRFLQNACLPVSLYRTAAAETNTAWADRYCDAVKVGLAHGCPSRLRGLVFAFVNSFQAALNYLKANHPPKVELLKEMLLRLGEGRSIPCLCTTNVEARAVELWKNTRAAQGCADLVPITRAQAGSMGINGLLVVPGMLGPSDSWIYVSGIASEVRVLVYPWQAARWNNIRGWGSRFTRSSIPHIEYTQDHESEFRYHDSISIGFTDPKPLDEDEERLMREVQLTSRTRRTATLKTTAGEFRYGEGALIPTVELDKLVDRDVGLIRRGDTILVRTDGNAIDARKRVDEISQVNPLLSALAERASTWRDLLLARWKMEQCSLPELHQILFPSEEVSYAAFRDWVLNPARIGPNNPNIILLLTRLGLDETGAEEIREDLRTYRSHRREVYRHLWTRSRQAGSRLRGEDGVGMIEEDMETGSELDMTLAALEELTTFAEVVEEPIWEDENIATGE
ncbi:MAG: hypothetical protein ACW99U_17250 [Candidatus Thorarchaeota archaeon]|jgi:hypothetical protein